MQEKATLRSLIHAGTEILRDCYDAGIEAREMLGRAEEKVFAILEQRGTGDLSSMRDVLHEALARIDARMKHEHDISGVETGFTDLDQLTGGLHDSELIILAARPSMGKTALAANIAEHVAIKAHITTLFVSLEMSRLELADRMLCSFAKINGHKLRNGTISNEERRKLVQKAAEMSEVAPLHRRHAQPHDDRDRRHGPPAEAQEQAGAGRHRLPAAHRAGQSEGPAAGAGGPHRPPPEGPGPRVEDSRSCAWLSSIARRK